MAPKTRVTKEEIVAAATGLVREAGVDALNARGLATRLNCSTQPIFSNFKTMEELRQAVMAVAAAIYCDYTEKEIGKGEFPPYKASGMAYIRFAGEEPELFRMLYMCDRSAEGTPENSELDARIAALVRSNTGLDEMTAKLFHLEMWAFVHGIAVMIATGYLELDRDLVSRMLSDCYMGLKKQYERE